MDENRKLDVAKIAAERWASANNNASRTDSKTYAAEVAQVFKDVYEALGDKQEVASQEPTLGQLSSAEAYAAYMRAVDKESQSIGYVIKKAQDGPQWVETPAMDGVYFIESPFNSMQARWVLVRFGFVSWFGNTQSVHHTESGILRFYGPMKAPV